MQGYKAGWYQTIDGGDIDAVAQFTASAGTTRFDDPANTFYLPSMSE
jgi:hypothetical protein